MNDTNINSQFGADQGGAPEIYLGRPTVAGNTGADVPKSLAKAFSVAGELRPEWHRLPKPGEKCALSGLSRTSINEAIERGDVRAITVRKPGATRGIKLVNRASFIAWLAKLDAEQNCAAGDTSTGPNRRQVDGTEVPHDS